MSSRIPKPFGGAMAMFASIVLIAGGSTFGRSRCGRGE